MEGNGKNAAFNWAEVTNVESPQFERINQSHFSSDPDTFSKAMKIIDEMRETLNNYERSLDETMNLMVKRDESLKKSEVMEATKSLELLPNQQKLLTLQSSSGTIPNFKIQKVTSSPEVITISSDDEENGVKKIKKRKRFKK